MTEPRAAAPLPRPDAGARRRPARRRVLRPRRDPLRPAHPRQPGPRAPSVGLHQDDDLLGDGSRDAILGELADEREHLAAIEALDPAGLSARGRASSATSRSTTSAARSSTPTGCGSGSAGRSPSITSATACSCCSPATTPRCPSASTRSPAGSRRPRPTSRRPRPGRPCRRSGAGSRSRSSRPPSCRPSSTRSSPPGTDVLPPAEQRRLERASESAKIAIDLYASWLEGTLPGGTDDWAIGRERHDALVALRAFDGLDADAILALGWEQLAEERAARAAAAREIDPDADEATVIDRVKSDQPADFDAALDAYRDAMLRARAHLIEHDLVTVPDDERIDVIATPEYLRNVLPVRRLLRAGRVRRESEGDLRRHAVGRARPDGDARAQPRLDQQHQHPRGLSRATISSSTRPGGSRR